MTKRMALRQTQAGPSTVRLEGSARERATEGAKAMSDYKAEGEAERAKTALLKALRLAKEAAADIKKKMK